MSGHIKFTLHLTLLFQLLYGYIEEFKLYATVALFVRTIDTTPYGAAHDPFRWPYIVALDRDGFF